MAPTKKIPTIPLTPDYDESTIEYIKHRRSKTNNNVTEEISERVPILPDNATAYQTIRFFAAFSQTRRHMQWTTGPTLYQRFPLHLTDTLLAQWELQIDGINRTVATFDQQFQAFKTALLQGYSYGNQVEFLRGAKKSVDQTPSQFLILLKTAEAHARMLPNAPANTPVFQDEERRRLFLKAMPSAWQEKFDDANLSVETETLNEMVIYFDKVQNNNPFVSKNDANNNGNNNSGNHNNNGNGRNGSGRNNGRNNNNRRNRNNNRNGRNNNGRDNNNNNNNSDGNQNNNNRQRIRSDDPCPLPGHGNHTWGECFSNINNPNARQRSTQRDRNSNNNTRESNATDANNRRNNNNDNNQDGNGNQSRDGDNYYYCLECSDDIEPDSFLFDGNYQTEFEPEIYDPDSTTTDPSESQPNVSDGKSEDEIAQLAPNTLTIAKKVNDTSGRFLFKSLLDHGGSHVLINRRNLPKDIELFPLPNSQGFNTAAGGLNTTHFVYLHDIILPEFSYTRRISTVKAFVFDNDKVFYDIIFGRSFLNSTGIDVCSSDLTCRWMDTKIPFHTPDFFNDSDRLRHLLRIDPVRIESFAASRVQVKPTYDTTASVDDVVDEQTHLSEAQRDQLRELMNKYSKLFDGSLGRYPKRKFHLELKEGATPYHCKSPYPVPSYNMPVLKQELDRQCQLGILEKCQESEWGMPLLVIPKKDGAIRTVDDFRELNKQLKRKQYPLPRIQDIFHRRKGYKYFTKLDLTLCYYNYELDEESSWMCVLVTPLGKYRRKRAPMGCSQSSDWAQGAIESALDDYGLLRDCVEAFIDDVGCFSNSWSEHLEHLERTFQCLLEHGYRVNPAKCEWGVEETDWLGH